MEDVPTGSHILVYATKKVKQYTLKQKNSHALVYTQLCAVEHTTSRRGTRLR